MDKKNLIWIIPMCLTIGFGLGLLITSQGLAFWVENYPMVDCIMNVDNSLNIEGNKLPFTKESQRNAVEWRCSKMLINQSQDYEDIFQLK